MKSLQFAVLASGSRGNSTLVCEAQGAGLLIDAGLGPRALHQRLESVDSDWSRIRAVVLTHTHGDHLDPSVLPTLRRHGVTLYCHESHGTHLDECAGFHELDELGLVKHYDGAPFLAPCGFRIEPIPVRHDGGATFGFRIETVARRRSRAMSVGFITDTGSWCERMADSLADVDVLGIEFNHDVAMQRASGRSPALIGRVLSDRGHLSNRQAAELVRSVIVRSRRDRVAHLVLLHLSEQCNRPELAIHEAREVIEQTGRRVLVHAARQSPAHPNLHLRPHSSVSSTLTPPPDRPAASQRRKHSPGAVFLPGLSSELP